MKRLIGKMLCSIGLHDDVFFYFAIGSRVDFVSPTFPREWRIRAIVTGVKFTEGKNPVKYDLDLIWDIGMRRRPSLSRIHGVGSKVHERTGEPR